MIAIEIRESNLVNTISIKTRGIIPFTTYSIPYKSHSAIRIKSSNQLTNGHWNSPSLRFQIISLRKKCPTELTRVATAVPAQASLHLLLLRARRRTGGRPGVLLLLLQAVRNLGVRAMGVPTPAPLQSRGSLEVGLGKPLVSKSRKEDIDRAPGLWWRSGQSRFYNFILLSPFTSSYIRRYQKSTNLLIPKLPFSRVIREICTQVRDWITINESISLWLVFVCRCVPVTWGSRRLPLWPSRKLPKPTWWPSLRTVFSAPFMPRGSRWCQKTWPLQGGSEENRTSSNSWVVGMLIKRRDTIHSVQFIM